ncbi:ABC transporter permease [Bordetella bronchiseptica]|uniref:ABC transporter permease protein n=3 Tax=Bordetella bronchiseptica TaxID=518 RepID=A0A0H3LMU4_BORBR|nr:ABC transporter permease [Bordetella bronchiseptica]KAK65681.1 ABC transporter, permease protein [Bordetella bronchiseptica 980-2]SHS38108.1 ABC-type spermidine/putrescine transport system, permease component II [Mycobacteroides abscessus subsp. abscessus]AMG88921.1 ABC transporter permease [Bordetella bronchiseptica]AWP75259.1 ABC transporter permease [Bordetella bronchiseptica]AWP84873.1 ABC transporter permease [Bordetella bronchiseptica]
MKTARLLLLCLLFGFLPLPIVIVAISSFTQSGYFSVPLDALSLRWYVEFFTDWQWISLLLVSAAVALGVALISTTAALLAALVLARRRFAGSGLLETLIMLPLVFPNAALGVAFLGVLGLLGIGGTYLGIVLAHCIITLPFAYRPILNALRKLDPALEEASMSLSATPLQVLRTVTLPMLRPGLITAFLFCFIVSFDEATVTIFLIAPDVNTLPVRILTQIQESASPVIAAIATFLILFTLSLVLLLERTVGLELFAAPQRER